MTALCIALCLAPQAEYRIPYRLTDTKHVLVRVKLNGRGPFNFILDTGAPAVFVPKKLAEDTKLKVGDDGWGKFDTFQVEGGLGVPGVKARVEDLFQLEGMNGLGLAGVELHGVIGYNVLAQFRITYDFTADALSWVPLPGFTPPSVGLGRGHGGQGGMEILGPVMKVLGAFMGLTPNFETRPRGFLGFACEERDGKLVVTRVLADGPAARLKAGDVLEAVTAGGKTREPADLKALDKTLAAVKAGDVVTFRVAGEPVAVTAGKGL